MDIKIDNEIMRDFVIDMLKLALTDYVENRKCIKELNNKKHEGGTS